MRQSFLTETFFGCTTVLRIFKYFLKSLAPPPSLSLTALRGGGDRRGRRIQDGTEKEKEGILLLLSRRTSTGKRNKYASTSRGKKFKKIKNQSFPLLRYISF